MDSFVKVNLLCKNQIINNLIFFLASGINYLFLLKYSLIYTDHYLFITILYFLLISSFYYLIKHKPGFFSLSKKSLLISATFVSIIVVFLVMFTDKLGSIGREPAIRIWLDNLFAGIFPWYSFITPSAFPFLYFLSIPFYLAGEIGLLIPLGMTGFYYILYIKKDTDESRSIIFLLFTFSLVTAYEAVVRSELTMNMLMPVILISIFNGRRLHGKSLLLFSILSGIILSTRSIVLFPLLIYSLYILRHNFRTLLIYWGVAGLIFIVSLLPFIFWDLEGFLASGPFAIQSQLSYLPNYIVALALLLGVLSGFLVSSLREVFFSAGVIILFTIIVSFGIKIAEFGFYNAFVNDKIDLSYLALVYPLMLLSFDGQEVDKFLGRLIVVK